MDENERAPRSVMEAAARSPMRVQPKQEIIFSTHRYFRIPFLRASSNQNDHESNQNGLNADSSELKSMNFQMYFAPPLYKLPINKINSFLFLVNSR